MEFTVFLVLFLALLAIGMPIAFSFLIPGVVYLLMTDTPMAVTGQVMLGQFLNFVLLAIPLFILAGELMNTSGITRRIFDFATAAVGHVRGGLGHVNVFASLIFSGISGSSAADAAGLGRVEIQAMREKGYRPEFAAAITACSSTIGPIIPPSIGLVLYGALAEVSIDYLFMAGILPGIVLGLVLMAAIYIQVLTGRENCPTDPFPGFRVLMQTWWRAVLPLTAPVVIVGGIVTGAFTPTEAGAVAVMIALLVGLIYRELNLSDIYGALMRASVATAKVMFILSTAALFAWVLTIEQVPDHVAAFMFSISGEKWVFILIVILTLLFLGLFESASANLLIVTPILVPIAPQFGMDLVHLGVVIVLTLMVGQITPPVGFTLYIVTDIAKVPMGRIVRATVPYLLAMIVAVFIVAYLPAIVLTIPFALGYAGGG